MSAKKVPYGTSLKPGTKVVREAIWNNDTEITSEYGVIVHCWFEQSIDDFDCYIAFFGTTPPNSDCPKEVYILRYAAVSLKTLDDWPTHC